MIHWFIHTLPPIHLHNDFTTSHITSLTPLPPHLTYHLTHTPPSPPHILPPSPPHILPPSFPSIPTSHITSLTSRPPPQRLLPHSLHTSNITSLPPHLPILVAPDIDGAVYGEPGPCYERHQPHSTVTLHIWGARIKGVGRGTQSIAGVSDL